MRKQIGFVSSRRAEESIAANMSVRENIYINPAATGRHVLEPISPQRRARRDPLGSGALFDQAARLRTRGRDAQRRQPAEGRAGALDGGESAPAGARGADDRRRCRLQGGDLSPAPTIFEGGLAVLLLSSDFEEVERICHRALVFSRGQVVSEIPASGLDVARLTADASGGAPRLMWERYHEPRQFKPSCRRRDHARDLGLGPAGSADCCC